ncbi:MAG: ATP-binding cassette domain-containing protein, partial [Deltaproteobacteria bacterium]|nr:ATP-binding cassette domain-containing protein [Deltaproteobacteria bacterium]
LVGESGCGKTTLGKVVLGLHKPDRGQIIFNDQEIGALAPRQRRGIQKDLQMIFQDPSASLNPRKKIYDILSRPLKTYSKLNKPERREAILRTCKNVGVGKSYFNRYPHQFSGGQRQRIAIARAIILNPALVIADEPISALDVSIQSQILNLIMDLQEELQLTFLFITHDISVVKHISDQVAVMYLGQIVELAPKADLFENPRHPYTKLLFSAVPDINRPFLSDEHQIKGEIPNPTDLPPGCYFAPRCPLQTEECLMGRPDLLDRGEAHFVRCFNV